MYEISDIEIEEKIASGGMADIFKAVIKGAKGFRKRCVLKKIRPEYASNKEFVESLIFEARIVERLNHANIVQVLHLGDIDGSLGILMEYVDGIDLEKILECFSTRNHTMPLYAGLFILKQICSGLQYAHKKTDDNGNPLNIVHRDISPQNIIVSKDGWAKITDFGIAKAATKETKTIYGTLKGKLLYMSPEQINSEDIDYRSDIFSVGVLAYEMLTGRKLFDADTEVKVIDKIRQFDPSCLQNTALPEEIITVLRKTLAVKREDRYQSCREIIRGIDSYVQEHNMFVSTADLADFVKGIIRIGGEGDQQTDSAPTVISQKPLVHTDKTPQSKRIKRRYLIILPVVFIILGMISSDTFKKESNIKTGSSAPSAKVTKQDETAPAPQPIKYGRLEVFANPWAYITVSGIASKKISPYRTSKIKPGTYKITAFYEPENKTVTGYAKVNENKRTFCTVDFLTEKPLLECR